MLGFCMLGKPQNFKFQKPVLHSPMAPIPLGVSGSPPLLKGPIPMNTAKDEVRELLDKLPENCSLEDVQYHLYVFEKIKHGLQVAEEQGALSQEEAEARLKKWLIE